MSGHALVLRPAYEMSNLLMFPRTDRRTQTALRGVQDEVARISRELRMLAIQLATESVWREWSDAVPEGTVMTFEAETLLQSGDPLVRRLVELDLETEVLVDEIDRRLRD